MAVLELAKRMSPLQRYAVLVVVVVVAVALYLFFTGQFSSGGDDGGGQQAAQAEPVEPVAPGAQGGAPVAYGESGRVGAIDFTVDEVDYPTEVAGGGIAVERFGLVRLRAVNRSDSPVLLAPQMLQIAASDGRRFAADAELSLGAAAAVPGSVAPPATLQPGLATNVIAVFQLPNDAGGLVLRLHGAWVDFDLDGG